jgi:hypothetical protein
LFVQLQLVDVNDIKLGVLPLFDNSLYFELNETVLFYDQNNFQSYSIYSIHTDNSVTG